MFLDSLETGGQSDHGQFSPRMRSLRIRRDVLPITISAYTERVYMQGKAE
jgi:hypothetical protein